MTVRIHRLALAAALVVTHGASQALSYDWATSGSGNWSTPSNWSGGVLPTGGAATSLGFGNPAPTLVGTWTITNDLPGVFALNALQFAGNTSAALTLRNASGSGLAFTGPGARIDVTGVGVHTLANQNTSALGLALVDNLAMHMGLGELVVSAPISGSGALTIDGNQQTYGLGRLTLSGANTFSGGVTLNSGNLILSGTASTAPVGTGTFTINGGVITSASATTRINAPVQLNADLRVINGTLAFNGPITVGNAAVALRNEGGSVTLNTALGITGATVIGVSSGYYPAIGPATLTLGGTTTPGASQGTLLNTSSITVAGGSTLAIDNSSTTTGNLANRINDSASVNMLGGIVSFRSAATGSSETLGTVRLAGYSTLEARPGTTGAGVLTLSSLERVERGVLLVRGQNLGNNAVTNHGSIVVGGAAPALVGGGGAAGSTTQSIVPWMVGNYSTTSSTGDVNSFVTYDAAGGLRPLNTATEFASVLGANASDNVALSALSSVNNSNVTVNALALRTDNMALTGSGSINVTSGAVLFSGSGVATVTNNFNFGSAEGVFTTNSTVAISGNLTGSNGLTKAGQRSLELSGDNTGLTGTLTLLGYNGAASRIDISAAQNLPGTGAIMVYSPSSTAVAGVGVSGIVTVNRDFIVRSGSVSLSTVTNAAEATFSGTVSGDGGVIVNASNSWGLVRLTGTNTYTGPTRLQAGYLEISNDAQLGNGGALILTTATTAQGLQLAGDWTTGRTVNVLSPTGFNTFQHNAVLNGALTGNGQLLKLGSGTLTINGSGSYNGIITVGDGSLFVNGTTAANVFFDGQVMGGSGRVGDVNFLGTFVVGAEPGAGGTFSAGSMTMLLGSHVAFDLGQDLLAIDNAFVRSDQGFGSQVTFDFSGAQAGGSYELVRFGGTSFSSADFAYTGLADGLTGSFSVDGHSLRFNVSAVPEPETYALLLAGLTVVGSIARRRRERR